MYNNGKHKNNASVDIVGTKMAYNTIATVLSLSEW